MPDDGNIVIDEEFRDLLPPLTAETYDELEKSIISEGCRDSIVLWVGVIVDGHNRYAICRKHDLPFQTVEKDFASRDIAKIWIISTQLARRHLSQKEQSYYRGVQFNLEKNVQGTRNQYCQKSEKAQNGPFHFEGGETAQRLANQYNVGRNTIKRDGQMASVVNKIAAVSPKAKTEILSGKADITKTALAKLDKVSDEEISAIAGQIEDGTYAKKPMPEEPPASDPEPVPEKTVHTSEDWGLPVPTPGKKQTLCAYISAGIDTLTCVIGNIEEDFRDKLPLVKTQAERNFIRDSIQSHIDKLLEIIKQI